MNRTGRRTRARVVVGAAGMALTVAVMHVLILCGSGSAPSFDASHTMPVMNSATAGVDHIGASMTDCAMHDHGCVFLRGELIVLTVALGFISLLPPVRQLTGVHLRRVAVVLGRPPPWAIADHLDLSVIVR